MAANFLFFYDSGLAEPLPLFALKAAMVSGADPDTAVRAEGLAVFAAISLAHAFTAAAPLRARGRRRWQRFSWREIPTWAITP